MWNAVSPGMRVGVTLLLAFAGVARGLAPALAPRSVARGARVAPLSMGLAPATSVAASRSLAKLGVRAVEAWVANRTLEQVLPAENASRLLTDILPRLREGSPPHRGARPRPDPLAGAADPLAAAEHAAVSAPPPAEPPALDLEAPIAADDAAARALFERLWARFDARVRREERTVGELLGEQGRASLSATLARAGAADDVLISALVSSGALADVLGVVLYEALFEFVTRADIVGTALERVPLLGPARRAVVDGVRAAVDANLGRQIRAFLGEYSAEAARRFAELLLERQSADGTQAAFGGALRASLTDALAARPVASLVPPEDASDALRELTWDALTRPPTGVRRALDALLVREVYAEIGAEPLGSALGVELAPEFRSLLYDNWASFVRSKEGRRYLNAAMNTLIYDDDDDDELADGDRDGEAPYDPILNLQRT